MSADDWICVANIVLAVINVFLTTTNIIGTSHRHSPVLTYGSVHVSVLPGRKPIPGDGKDDGK